LHSLLARIRDLGLPLLSVEWIPSELADVVAGVLEAGRIVATKIPKSGCLRAYLAEEDLARRRALYCHCPRIRDVLLSGETLPKAYCACGAGFYQGIWEEITQAPVKVEVLESVLAGGEVCRVGIYIRRRRE
jgi:hypothetical protein